MNPPNAEGQDLPDEDSEATVIVPASQQARYFAAAVAATPGHTPAPNTPGDASSNAAGAHHGHALVEELGAGFSQLGQ